MNKKKGFTLVELLAVIVILAVILVIAVPKITGVIKNAKKSSMEDASKLIATQAEKQWLINQTLSPSDSGYVDLNSSDACSKVSKYNSSDYESCNLTLNDNGEITSFSMTGKGKFAGLTCFGTSSSNITCNESDGSEQSDTSLACNTEYCYLFGTFIGEVIDYDIDTETCLAVAEDEFGFYGEETKESFCDGTGTSFELTMQDIIDSGDADWLKSIGVIKNVVYGNYNSEIKTNWKNLKDNNNNQRTVFLKFKNDLSEIYTCTLYSSTSEQALEPTCFTSEVFNNMTEDDLEWNRMKTLFGHNEENQVCDEYSSNAGCVVNTDSVQWSCYSSNVDGNNTYCSAYGDGANASCFVYSTGKVECFGD